MLRKHLFRQMKTLIQQYYCNCSSHYSFRVNRDKFEILVRLIKRNKPGLLVKSKNRDMIIKTGEPAMQDRHWCTTDEDTYDLSAK